MVIRLRSAFDLKVGRGHLPSVLIELMESKVTPNCKPGGMKGMRQPFYFSPVSAVIR